MTGAPVYTFSGRRVLITGGGSGVGAAMARGFAGAGADVVITGRRQSALDEVAAASDKITTSVCDVTDEAAVTGLFDHIPCFVSEAGGLQAGGRSGCMRIPVERQDFISNVVFYEADSTPRSYIIAVNNPPTLAKRRSEV